MRIGKTIIDIESLSLEDLKVIEHEIHVCKRHEEKESFKLRMQELLEEAQAAGFDFIDKFYGNVIRPRYIEMHDNQ